MTPNEKIALAHKFADAQEEISMLQKQKREIEMKIASAERQSDNARVELSKCVGQNRTELAIPCRSNTHIVIVSWVGKDRPAMVRLRELVAEERP